MPSRESDLIVTGLLGTYLKLSTACRTLSNRENDFDGESDGDLWSQVSTHNGAAFVNSSNATRSPYITTAFV